MRYLKKDAVGRLIEYFGPAMGKTWFRVNGWTEYAGRLPLERLELADGAITELPVPEVTLARRFSRLLIIRELGDEWPAVRAKLDAAGVLDQFFAADWLTEDDPQFAAILDQWPEDQRARLDNCLWRPE